MPFHGILYCYDIPRYIVTLAIPLVSSRRLRVGIDDKYRGVVGTEKLRIYKPPGGYRTTLPAISRLSVDFYLWFLQFCVFCENVCVML